MSLIRQIVSGLSTRSRRWLGQGCRKAVALGIGYLGSRPRLHRRLRLAYRLVPGLRGRLLRLAPPPAALPAPLPPPPPPVSHPNDRYIYRPSPPSPVDGAPLTLDDLYHLSRAI